MSRVNEILDYKVELEKELGTEITINELAFKTTINAREKEPSLASKILILIGAIVAGAFFFGSLAINGLLNAPLGMLMLSLLMFGLALFTELKLSKNVATNAFNLVFYIIAFSTLGASLYWFEINDNINILILIILWLGVLAFSKNYISTFSATIGVNFLIFFWIVINRNYDLLNAHAIALALISFILFKNEAFFIKLPENIRRMFLPLRSALIIALVYVLSTIGFNHLAEFYLSYTRITGIVLLFLIAYVLYQTNISGVEKKTRVQQTIIAFILLAPLILAPAVLGGLFVTLLCFRANYRTGFVLGILCSLYFIGQFYYDLKLTLFYKSILMLSTGTLFLTIQYILHKNNYFDEKN